MAGLEIHVPHVCIIAIYLLAIRLIYIWLFFIKLFVLVASMETVLHQGCVPVFLNGLVVTVVKVITLSHIIILFVGWSKYDHTLSQHTLCNTFTPQIKGSEYDALLYVALQCEMECGTTYHRLEREILLIAICVVITHWNIVTTVAIYHHSYK